MQRMNKNKDYLDLSPIIKDYIEYQLLEQEKGKYKIKSGMNFITWLWGSGKTFFIEETLKYFKNPENHLWETENHLWETKNHLWETKDYLWKREFIRIDFSPRNLETTGSIYSHFLDTFISELLSKKYDPNLKSYKSNLLKILGAWTGNNYLDMFFKLFNSPSENVQDILKSINNSLQTTYKDYFIVVVIDDIDRVEKKDLLNIGKILNLLKNLTDIQKEEKPDSNLICFYSADSNYLNNFYLWDSQEEKGINFYQYFNKFRDTQIDIYESTYENLITFLANSIIEIKDNKGTRKTRYLCKNLCDSLKEKDIAVTIRDLLFLKKEILGKFQQNIDQAKKKLEKYNDIISGEEYDSYFYFWDTRVNIFLLYLYTKSVYEKDPYILSDLKFYSDKTGLRSHNLRSEEARIREIKDKHSFIFKHLNLDHFWEDKYNLIEKLIHNQNDTKSFSRYIFDAWKASIIEKIKKPDFDTDNKFPEIVNRLFSPLEDMNEPIIKDIFESISNNRSKDDHLVFSNFFDNYIQIIRKYFTLLRQHNWKDTEIEKWFINSTIDFFWMFTDMDSSPIKNVKDPDWSLKEERSEKIKGLLKEIREKDDSEKIKGLLKEIQEEDDSEKIKELLKEIQEKDDSEKIKGLLKEIQEKDDIVHQFIFLYLILKTHSYSKKNNKKDLEELIESFSPSEIVNNSKIVNNEDASILNLTKKFLEISSNISCDDKVFIETLWTLLRDLIHREWKDLPLLRRFWEEHSLLLLIYSMIYRIDIPMEFSISEQDEEEKECYKKIYQELLESKWWNITDLIEQYKDKILIQYSYWGGKEVDLLSNLEGKFFIEDIPMKDISIEDISNSLNKLYW